MEYIKNKKLIKNHKKKIEKMINFKEITQNPIINIDTKYHLVLSSGAIKGFYFIGINYYIKKFLNSNNILSIRGTSAGALNAVYFCIDLNIEDMINIYFDCANLFQNYNLSIIESITRINEKILPDNIHELCNKFNVEIITTKVTKNGLVTTILKNFKSKKDVIESINCSMCIPFFSYTKKPFMYKYNDEYFIDGVFIKNNEVPVYNNNEIKEKQLVIQYNKIKYKNKFIPVLESKNIINLMTKSFYEFNDFLSGNKYEHIYLI
jgi:predicted patatin/cPLA2 family phospholipase